MQSLVYKPLGDGTDKPPHNFYTTFSFLWSSLFSSTARWAKAQPTLYRQAVYAFPSTIPCVSWTFMLTVFITSYLNSRDPQGHIPRISEHYSTFPYISCIGALHIFYFRATSILAAICIITSFLLDYHFGKNISSGKLWRRIKIFWGVITSIFLVAMSRPCSSSSLASMMEMTSILPLSLSTFGRPSAPLKLSDFVSLFLMRKVNKANRYLIFAKKWKKCGGFIGAHESNIHSSTLYC
jgi:hypothetical protein